MAPAKSDRVVNSPDPEPQPTEAPVGDPTSAPADPGPADPDFRPGTVAVPPAPSGKPCMECGAAGDHNCRVAYRSPGVPTITRIPRGTAEAPTRITISMMPHNVEVISNLEVTREFTPNLDPGLYMYKLTRTLDPPVCSMIWHASGMFLVDLTMEQYKRMQRIRPKLARGIHTTDGPRWVCGFVGCGQRFTSVTQAVQHEGEHFGRDFLHEEDPDMFEEGVAEVGAAAQQHRRLLAAQRANKPAPPIDVAMNK